MEPTLDFTKAPSLPLGAISTDREEFVRLRTATPGVPESQSECFALKPGTCVKTYTGKNPGGWPTCGIVHKNTDAECIVVGHGWMDSDSERFVWRGTKSDFDQIWRID